MLQLDNINLKKRFVSDMNLPIGILDEPYFSYFLNLYEKNFGSLTKWNNLLSLVNESFGSNGELFLSEYYKVRDNMITDILSSESYKEFNDMDMSMFAVKNHGFSSSNIYNEENANKRFISIDLKKANFQALRLVNVLSDSTYEDFVSRYTNIQYIKDSKYTRQVVFGKLNPKRQIAVEKYIIYMIYDTIMSNMRDFTGIVNKVESFASDEIVFSVFPNIEDKDVNAIITPIGEYVKHELGFLADTEYFKLDLYKFYTCNNAKIPAYVKRFLNLDKDSEIMTVPLYYYAQVYKLLNHIPVEDMDLTFNMEGQPAKFLSGIYL